MDYYQYLCADFWFVYIRLEFLWNLFMEKVLNFWSTVNPLAPALVKRVQDIFVTARVEINPAAAWWLRLETRGEQVVLSRYRTITLRVKIRTTGANCSSWLAAAGGCDLRSRSMLLTTRTSATSPATTTALPRWCGDRAGKGDLVCACVRRGDMFCVQYSIVATHFAHLAAYFVILVPATVY